MCMSYPPEDPPKSEKPRKRLVPMPQYVKTLGQKGMGYSAGTILSFAGFIGMVIGVILIMMCFTFPDLPNVHLWEFIVGSVLGGLGITGAWLGNRVMKITKKIEPVNLITRRTANLLPQEDTLVRASERPLSQQKAELLRAATTGQETPPEELLRPGQEGIKND
ncbi:MAG: hypothetical protein JWN14_2596 [Chthonomonadales bacterium]|nr:hypothetical protein [Chthonomonadales bacterium]